MKRLLFAAIANGIFPIVGMIGIWINAFVIEKQMSGGVVGALIGAVAWTFLIAYITLPAIICSSIIFLAGGFIHPKAAMAAATLTGSMLVFMRMTGDFAHAMRFRQSDAEAAVLALTYALCWLATIWLFARIR